MSSTKSIISISNLKNNLELFYNQLEQVDKIYNKRATYKDEIEYLNKQNESLEKELKINKEALNVVKQMYQHIQNKIHEKIALLVTKCIRSIFLENIEFVIKFEEKKSRTEANLIFVKDDMELDPMESTGGGVMDVASFAIRLAYLMIKKPKPRNLIIMDEPFRFVSEEARYRIRALIEQLARDLDIQFIIVTHQSEIVTGKVIQMS